MICKFLYKENITKKINSFVSESNVNDCLVTISLLQCFYCATNLGEFDR